MGEVVKTRVVPNKYPFVCKDVHTHTHARARTHTLKLRLRGYKIKPTSMSILMEVLSDDRDEY